MRVNSLEFRETRPGEYFPPIIPNGRFFARPVGGDRLMEILAVTDAGLSCNGVSYAWADLQGISIGGDVACLVSEKYVSGGFRFYLGECRFIGESGNMQKDYSGYPVEYCLMNRATFERQALAPRSECF